MVIRKVRAFERASVTAYVRTVHISGRMACLYIYTHTLMDACTHA